MASKGPRSTNWNSNEKNVLLDLITEVIDTIENKKTDFLANNAKHQAWQQVLSGFSATFGKTRELKELKDQWKRSKQIAKKGMVRKERPCTRYGRGTACTTDIRHNINRHELVPQGFCIHKEPLRRWCRYVISRYRFSKWLLACNTRNHQVLPYHFQCSRLTRIWFCWSWPYRRHQSVSALFFTYIILDFKSKMKYWFNK